jgi:large subunit ribosomal protein L15
MVAVKKAGRGAGKRGGRGLAGINKHRVMTRIKYMPNHWGMHGFNRHPSLRTVNVTINVAQLEDLAGDADSVNLTEMGIDKLLGSGRISKAITVTVSEASAKATEKIEAAGGSLNMDQADSDEFVEE